MAFLYITAYTPHGIVFGRTSLSEVAHSECIKARDALQEHVSGLTSLVLFRDEGDSEILLPGAVIQQSVLIFQVADNVGDVKPPKGTLLQPISRI